MKKILLSALMLGAFSAAHATPITITNGYGTTDAFDALGAGNTPALSIYSFFNDPNNPLTVNSADDLIGQLLSFNDSGNWQFSELINNTSGSLVGASSQGYNTFWNMSFDYSFQGFATFIDGNDDGTLGSSPCPAPNAGSVCFDSGDGIFPTFTSGVINIYYHDGLWPFPGFGPTANNGSQVLRLNLKSSSVQPLNPNVLLDFEVDYTGAWFDSNNTFVKNFFTDTKTGKSLYELSQMEPPPVMSFLVDLNVNPNKIPVITSNQNSLITLQRSTDLNVTGEFLIPEPASVAVFGLGLLLLGFRNRKASTNKKLLPFQA